MDIEARLTISHDLEDGTVRISIEDDKSSANFFVGKMSANRFVAAMRGLCNAKFEEAQVQRLDVIGKRMIIDKLEFQMPEDIGYDERIRAAKEISQKECPEGWKSDKYFGSQSSFFHKDGKLWGRATIRKWVSSSESIEGGE